MRELPAAVIRRLRYRGSDQVRKVQKAVASFYGITLEKMLSKSRRVIVSWPRQVALALCAENKLGSYDGIGNEFSQNITVDHRVVAYAINSVARFSKFPEIAAEINDVRRLVKTVLCQSNTITPKKSSRTSTRRSFALSSSSRLSRQLTPSRA